MAVGSNVHFINNLFVSHGGQGSTRGFGVTTYTNYSSSDYNGFYIADSFDEKFNWTSPPDGVVADYEHSPVARSFDSLRDYAAATGQDTHSVLFAPGDFVSFEMPDDSDKSRMYPPEQYDPQTEARFGGYRQRHGPTEHHRRLPRLCTGHRRLRAGRFAAALRPEAGSLSRTGWSSARLSRRRARETRTFRRSSVERRRSLSSLPV